MGKLLWMKNVTRGQRTSYFDRYSRSRKGASAISKGYNAHRIRLLRSDNPMSSSTLFENGTIVDGTGAVPLAGAVLVEGDTIAAVGEEATHRVSGETKRIDARGMTVMPGLIDAHVHLSFDDAQSNAEIFFHRRNALSALVATYNARKVLRAGVTGILDPDSVYECTIDVRDAIETGVVEGPRIACGAYALMTSVGGTAGRLIPDHGAIGWGKVLKDKDEIVS